MIKYSKLMILESANYLSTPFPDNFSKMSDDEVLTFIEENVWTPFKSEPADIVWDFIVNAVEELALFLEENDVVIDWED